MYSVNAAFDTDTFDVLAIVTRAFPGEVRNLVKSEIRPLISRRVDTTLRRQPGKVKYPIQWTSEKQKRAFFATDGFGHGIPYRRTGRLVQSWHVRGNYTNEFTGIEVYNDAPAARYVQGNRMQRFHTNTGWKHAPTELQYISLEANEALKTGVADLLVKLFRTDRPGRGRAK